MIPFEFDYYKPSTSIEAVNLFCSLKAENKSPVYFSGGTEIISRARVGNMHFGSVIDIKGITECNNLGTDKDRIYIGAAVELNKITESNIFPLLGNTVKRIADHTIQCKITIGGNVMGSIKYKEGILPLMLSDAEVYVRDNNGVKNIGAKEFFCKKPMLEYGQLVEGFSVARSYACAPWFHRKEIKMEKIDYPLVTIAAMRYQEKLRIALSGLVEYPFRSENIERIINNGNFDINRDFGQILSNLPDYILEDKSGSNTFRQFVLRKLLATTIKEI